MTSTSKGRPILKRAVYKSDLEDRLAAQLEDAGIDFGYEETPIAYTVPERQAKYYPDFHLRKSGILIEGKGRFGHRGDQKRSTEERQKMVLLKQQRPDLDIRIVFSNPNLKIYKGSKTTYADWANHHGFKWAAGKIPEEWIEEARQYEAP